MEETKESIRKRILAMRRRIPALMLTQKSGIIEKRLMQTAEWKMAKSIYTYISLPGEVETNTLVTAAWEEGKTVAAPRVEGDDLVFCQIRSFDDLKEGYFHVMEPQGIPIEEDAKALIVMPGVAFDVKKHRIGYGRGFYDRWLAAHPGHPTAALSFDFALEESVPSESTDMVPDMLITDRGIIR
ncbi:MAG: 5-formyltetrahydrofolate cyclo-ligase [Eubacteriales bacterium]|jgi:5-formyltetrahydrofolate cyclo-ligase|nr:5-formyltetrahydrofolate cyclo-ligase [Lachnospiraceae bacterium]MDD5859083.1 5-formyltetrahydrofolate cyclo-ligase [Eubacteriales bacterium]MCH4064629.1 5-formyltetrahydrofolate cyclo-ligase [Lachnospiraceae bacterium]MCH4104860.1 5-formyltetrahydrofolate cyclo-ligase [Lachnospiraceae bacterium]MCI1309755.1 5-formyltetrahydrofolate cyclo-ligase [Lachnospiraceae bacterium]